MSDKSSKPVKITIDKAVEAPIASMWDAWNNPADIR
jgi:hypothetical protein